MWDKLGKEGSLPFEKNPKGAVSAPSKQSKTELEEEKKKRKGYLRYNRSKYGISGDKSEPELIEVEE
jgi:hypothetical protein